MSLAKRISILSEDGKLSPDELEVAIVRGLGSAENVEVVATGTKSHLTGDAISYVQIALNLSGVIATHVVAAAIYDLSRGQFRKFMVRGKDVTNKSKAEIEHILDDDESGTNL